MFSQKCIFFNPQLEEKDKILKRKERFGIATSASSGDSTDVSFITIKYKFINNCIKLM